MGLNDFREDMSAKAWNRLSVIFDGSTRRFEQMYCRTIEKTRKYLKAGDTVLEVGCGTGTLTVEISDNVNKIIAIDISSKMLKIAKEKADEHKTSNIEFLQTTVFDSRFKEESFDAVLAFNVTPYLKDKKKAVERIRGLLKPGGYFISVTPCVGKRKPFAKVSISLLFFLINTIGVYSSPFNFSLVENLITDSGFQIAETEDLQSTEKQYFIAARSFHHSP